MYHRSKQFQSFIIGCLASLMVFGYPARLLASTSDPQEIQGVTSDHQEPPATPSEFEDVITGMDAGVDAQSLIQPSPDPIREYTAFLADIWDALFTSDYSVDSSYIQAGEWITTPTGTVAASNENGETVTLDVTLSLEFLPDQFSYFDQETLDLLSSYSTRLGVSWVTMTNNLGISVPMYVYWVQHNDDAGEPSALIFPINMVSQSELDMYGNIIPYMDGFFDDPHYYNIEDYDPSIFGVWSNFKNSVRSAVNESIIGVVVVGVTAAGTVLASPSLAVIAGAVITIVAAMVGGQLITTSRVLAAFQTLRDELNDLGYDTDGMTNGEVLDLAQRVLQQHAPA